MPTPEEERRKRSLLEQALASLQGAGESAARIGKDTAGSIANAIGGGFSDVAGRLGQTAEAAPPPSVRPESIAPPEPMGPPDPMDAGPQNSKMDSATLPPRPQSNPPIARMRPGAILPMRGNAQPTNLEGGEPSINRLLSQATSYHEKSPNPDLSSTFDLGSLAPLDNIIKEEPQVADVSNVTKDSFATLGGGDLVDSWNEVKTAQKELGSFSDSAGKWWSVLLAAMFPQYGSALNLIGNMKSNKYRAAMDKYDTAFKSQRTPKHDVRNLDGGYYSIDGEIKQLPLDPKSVETEIRYGELPGGETVLHQIRKGSTDDPYYTYEDSPMEGVTRKERIPTYDAQTYRTKLTQNALTGRAEDTQANRATNEAQRFRNQATLKQMGIDAGKEAIRLRADLTNDIPAASRLVQAAYANDVDFLVSSGAKGVDMLTEATIKKADELKAARKARQGSGGAPAPQDPAAKNTGQQVLVME